MNEVQKSKETKKYEKPTLIKYGILQDITKGYHNASACTGTDCHTSS